MSMQPEGRYSGSVVRLLPDVHHEKNHNIFRSGTADYWFSGCRSDLWVEFKYLVKGKIPTTFVKIHCSPLQLQWLAQRHEEGRKVCVIVGCKEGGVIFKDRSWEEKISSIEFRLRLCTYRNIAKWIKEQTGEKSRVLSRTQESL